MTNQQFESGWENPDHHPGLEKRARPMFDKDGNPVTSVPEPEPLTPAERAMFEAVDISREGAAERPVIPHPMDSFPHTINRPLATGGPVKSTPILVGEQGPERIEPRRIALIRELATRALDNPSPASWAVALDEIIRELDA